MSLLWLGPGIQSTMKKLNQHQIKQLIHKLETTERNYKRRIYFTISEKNESATHKMYYNKAYLFASNRSSSIPVYLWKENGK